MGVQGKFTIIASQGRSVIDYAIVSSSVFSMSDAVFDLHNEIDNTYPRLRLHVHDIDQFIEPKQA